MQKKKVTFFISDMIIGGTETVFVDTINELLNYSEIELRIVTKTEIKEPLYVNWLASHPDINVYVFYPLQSFFEGLKKYCKVFPLENIRKIIFSLYKKYRRTLINLTGRLNDADVLIDYKNFEFYRELKHCPQRKIAWLHGAVSYFKNDLLKRVPLYDKVVVITEEFVNICKKDYPQIVDKLVHIYNPLNIEAIQNKSNSTNIPEGKYFCHVARLAEGKDIDTVLDSFDIFYKTHKDYRLYIIGGGDKAEHLKRHAKCLASSQNIIFTGSIDNPYGYMAGAVANILSSEHEGFGMVLVESMALSSSIVSSNYKCGAKEILNNGEYGYLFEIGNIKELAECMESIVQDSAVAQKKARKALNSLKRFSVKKIVRQIMEFVINE